MRAIHGPFFAATLLASSFLLSGCDQVRLVGSGTIVEDTPPIADFATIDASHAFKVTITAGPEFRVLVRADDNVMPHVKVRKNAETLELDLKENFYNLQNVTLEAEVTMPKLLAVRLSGASNASLAGFDSSEPFRAGLSGASKLTGQLKSGDAEFDLSGASSVTLKGSGGAVEVDTSGSSSAKLSEFAVTDADVGASGSSRVSVNASGTLNAKASGSSRVVYSGNPALGKTEVSGSASIKAK